MHHLVLLIGARLFLIDYCLLGWLCEALFMRCGRNDWYRGRSFNR